MKRILTALLVLGFYAAPAQTLFYYGKDSVSVKDFLRAYNKNNTGPKTAKSLQEYLDLYIVSRLKIQEAKARRYDTLPQFIEDLEHLREEVMPSYINDKQFIDGLVNEAFQRSQKDIHLAHIFISTQDTVAAQKKLAKVQELLRNNTEFSDVARQYSDDPNAKNNGGNLGYITVFSLPYPLENLAYNTHVGKVSSVYRSYTGYHIFKNLGERRNAGKIKAAQILLAFPPGSDEATKQEYRKRADSLYARLLKGEDFGKLATQYSNDMFSAAAKGEMQPFGAGEYDEMFERQVFALQPGAISKPFLTEYGYHIVKRLSKVPAPLKNDAKTLATLRDRVQTPDRLGSNKTALAEKIKKLAHFKRMPFREADLWAFSDSIFLSKSAGRPLSVNFRTPLFVLDNDTTTVADWINYGETFRFKQDGTGQKPYPQVWQDLVEVMTTTYFFKHMEDFNEEFRYQLTEFKEGNLFFEIMQQQIWGPAQNDSAALVNYFENNRSRYFWKKSADVVLFYANDVEAARNYHPLLKKAPANWAQTVSAFTDKIATDSGRFELSQVPNPTKIPLKPGVVTSPLVNKTDNTASFAYVIRIHGNPEPRSFSEAKGLVINDYQAELEKKWVAALKAKYPVRINQDVWAKLAK